MTEKVRRMYDASIKNALFLKEMIEDNSSNKKPGWFASEMDKITFATIYYGWLLGRQDPELALHV